MDTVYFIKVGENEYPALAINGRLHNEEWDGRHTKTFRIEATYEEAMNVFVDDVIWSIVSVTTEDGVETVEEFNNSDFSVAGDITDHRDGTVSVTMGKMTDLEEAYELLYGGDEE